MSVRYNRTLFFVVRVGAWYGMCVCEINCTKVRSMWCEGVRHRHHISGQIWRRGEHDSHLKIYICTMKKTHKMMFAGLLGVATLASAGAASAHLGNSEAREVVKAAVEANDYSAFQEAASEGRIIEKIDTAEKFAQLVEAKELKESGDIEGAQAIRDELGLKKGRGGKDPAVRAAIEANDYAAFQVATEGKRIAQKIDTVEKFGQLVEIHALREAGQDDEAKALKEELGIGHGDRDGHKGRGHHGDREEK